MKKEEIANHFFARNAKLTALYIAPDGQAFEEEHKADAHAQRFPNGKSEKFLREESEVGKAEAKQLAEKEAAEKAKAASKKTEEAKKAAEDAKAAEAAKTIPVVGAAEVKPTPKSKTSNPKKK